MAKIITPISRSAQPGERRFAERLRTALDDDYLCWHDAPVGDKRQHPDFVLLHPRRGLLVLEVKDWNRDTFRRIDPKTCEIFADGRLKTVANPLEQARQYAQTIVNLLSADRQLQDPNERFRGKLCFPWGYGVVLTKITRRELDEMLRPDEQDQVFRARLTICKDEMAESADPVAMEEQLWGMFQHRFGKPLSLPQIDRVRHHLYPDIRIKPKQVDLFDSSTGQSSTGLVSDIVSVMDLQQEALARSLGEGHRVIHGVSGSGKTLILGYRCRYLAQHLHKPILVLCFNVDLAAKLRAFIIDKSLASRVNIYHFHGWCKSQLETYHVSVPDGGEELYQRQVSAVIDGVNQGFIPRAQYGAVMIDEGHDFAPEWLKLITQMTDPANDSLLLLYDDAQSIYQKRGLDFSLSSVGIKAQGRTTILRVNYRNTREILDFAYRFASEFLDPKTASEDGIPLVKPEARGDSGHTPHFCFRQNLDDEVDYAVKCIRKWKEDNVSLGEIAVLFPKRFVGHKLEAKLRAACIPCSARSGREGKLKYEPTREQVSLLTLASSKGLEFERVIIVGLAETAKIEEFTQADAARLLYVGMTRARDKLVITSSERDPITERLQELVSRN
ncbi:MAG: 3'-5' exonuclease [Verrucomicrobiales bacterium]